MLEKILIADDNVDIRSRFYEIFFSLGYDVTCVPTGKEALIVLTDNRFDLILLDENMPELGGVETAKKIREFDQEVKIILLYEDKPPEDKNIKIQTAMKKDFSSHLMMKTILEILKEEQIPTLAETQERVWETKKERILVVDDNAEIRKTLELFLMKKGYNVQVASSGEDALMKIKIDKPRIVFLDMRMPGMDGLIVLRQIKRLDEKIQVVMLTSVQEEYIIEQAKKEGACDYLIKPCDLQKLEALITAILLQDK